MLVYQTDQDVILLIMFGPAPCIFQISLMIIGALRERSRMVPYRKFYFYCITLFIFISAIVRTGCHNCPA